MAAGGGEPAVEDTRDVRKAGASQRGGADTALEGSGGESGGRELHDDMEVAPRLREEGVQRSGAGDRPMRAENCSGKTGVHAGAAERPDGGDAGTESGSEFD